MKMDQASLAYIQNVVQTAELAKIGSIIIEPGKVRAIDEDRTVVLYHDKGVPDLPFGSIGLNRIDVFMSRFNIARGMSNFEMDVTVEGEGTEESFARAINMKGKGFKVDYRCANPKTIQAPKSLNDAVKHKIRMTPEAVLLMQQGTSAMKADEITFIGTDKGVSFEIADINSDKLTYSFADTIENTDDDDGEPANFVHKYPIKTVTTLFKANPDGNFYVTSRGMLKIVVNNLDILVVPRT